MENHMQGITMPAGTEYLIFSDESGSWHDEERGLYVRSWVRITPEQYQPLKEKIVFLKHQKGISELKWQNWKRDPEAFEEIFSQFDFKAFITVSDPLHFNPQSYTMVKDIDTLPVSTGGHALADTIKDKLKNSAAHQLFLAYYERTHILNSVNALLAYIDLPHCKYEVDKPQYLPDDWIACANTCGIPQGHVKIIEKSSSVPGIELADIIAGCAKDVLTNSSVALQIYQKYMYPNHMIDMQSRFYPNPNLIFYPDFPFDVRNSLLHGFRP